MLNAPQQKTEIARVITDDESGISVIIPPCDDYIPTNVSDNSGYMVSYLCKNSKTEQGFSVFISINKVFNTTDDNIAYAALEKNWLGDSSIMTFKTKTSNHTKILGYPALDYTGQQSAGGKFYDAKGEVVYLTGKYTLVDLIYYGNSITDTTFGQFVNSLKIKN